RQAPHRTGSARGFRKNALCRDLQWDRTVRSAGKPASFVPAPPPSQKAPGKPANVIERSVSIRCARVSEIDARVEVDDVAVHVGEAQAGAPGVRHPTDVLRDR